MTTTNDLNTTPLSGYNHIDALLDAGPDWNFLTGAANTITYTFSVASGNESGVSGQQAFSTSQQAYARQALQYIAQLTGIKFVETTNGSAAQVHLCNTDITYSPYTSGLCSWATSYSYDPGTQAVSSYKANVYVYLDNAEFRTQNANLSPGGWGYETLLHELGHMLGLKHSFEAIPENANVLPSAQDNTYYTLMSYDTVGGAYSKFSQYDVAALMWLYGGDGLGGALGIGSASGARYLVGTGVGDSLTGAGANDFLRGGAGNDTIDGGAGSDTIVYAGAHSAYTFTASGGVVTVYDTTGIEGTDRVSGAEYYQFSDGTFALSQLTFKDTTPPAAPVLNANQDASGLVGGAHPVFNGTAEAGASVRVSVGSALVGIATAGVDGTWELTGTALANGSYTATAVAVDAASNVSGASQPLSFTVNTSATYGGTAGNDSIAASAGDTVVEGHGGVDTLSYGGAIAGFGINGSNHGFTVADNARGAGTDTLFDVERLHFADADLAIDINGHGGQAYRIYQAAFDRAPDMAGVGFWMSRLDDGATVDEIASGFVNSQEFVSKYGSDISNSEFVNQLYQNVLHRAGEQAGVDFWVSGLDSNATTRAEVLADFSESSENQAQVVGTIANGFLYTPWA